MSISSDDKIHMASVHTDENCRDPHSIVKGEGTLLIDENGKTYIDAISSWWSTYTDMPTPT